LRLIKSLHQEVVNYSQHASTCKFIFNC